ncbi:unnamed protein product [Adineta steineri]|uniref:G-protein coupled receptors family 1 profile domain-containing protein n=1 Tax=Adineta steineri TaxID=433720 RepID=A0A819CJY3_9BILA|nr:unnamed protein product [Adineta steineri]CAF3809311.1 unnamed protein product [Adineta steineri]
MNTTTLINTDDTAILLNISQKLYGWGSLIIFLIGTFGNILDIILFIHLESLNTLASSLFLLASFIGSEFVMLTATLLRTIFGLTGSDPLFASLFLCKARWMIGPASGAFALTCVSLAGVDRYILARTQYQTKITLNQARLVIILAAIFWLGFFSMYAVFYVAPTRNSCQLIDTHMIQLMPFVSLFVYSVIPITVLSLLCRLIWHALGQLPITYLHGGIRLQDQVTRMIIAQIFVIVITSLPSAAYSIYTISTRTISKSTWRLAVENLVNTICVLIGFLTHAIMFYVYLIASPSFHQNVKNMFHVAYNRIIPFINRIRTNRQVVFPAV